ncbi:LapB repeat-containing protein [Listeria cornellensis]|uniref:Cell wall surface anchor (LPXTG motif) family protein n=1 Tax=Listeria cornellensis FSL F6-0969 TaxID=1265820 RepID=W7C475_9LIST|nr:LapB repeat-containing protein [Listeria cornellensis]EUJ31887.1 cell wall surface anchor (LPXTG motif) family protein [Listeria cornellensis FSL F6-0969]
MKHLKNGLKLLICIVIVFGSIGLSTSTEVTAESPLSATLPAPINQVFPDAALAQVIATKLGKTVTDTVTVADLNTITSISDAEGSGKGITSLDGMQNLNNIQGLRLNSNNISDLTPIAGLTNITSLYISANHISDITPLAGLTKLVAGRFDSQTITLPQVSNNGSLVLNLTGVLKNMSGDIPTTINTISNSGSYSIPNVTWNGLTSQTSLSFRFIQDVVVNGAVIGTFHGTVTQPTQNVALNPIGPINTIFPDENLAQIIATKLGKNVTDIVNQADLNTIVSLGDSETLNRGITSLVGMEHLKYITSLNLINNNISDVTPLSGLTQLGILRLIGNHINDISPLANLTNLSSFRFDSQTFTSPAVNTTDPLSIVEMSITSIDGSQLPPDTISNGGTFIAPMITWTGLTNQLSVQYTFAKTIVLGGYAGSFQGTVTIPLIPDTTPPVITADSSFTYEQHDTATASQFLLDVNAITDDGSVITSDFATAVNLDVVGDYTVTLNSTDNMGNVATPETVTVHVVDTVPPVITADSAYTYESGSVLNEAIFLQDIHAKTDDGSAITSDFVDVVDSAVVGDYTVTLTATDQYGNVANPVRVVVHIVDTTPPVITASPIVTYEIDQAVSESDFLDSIAAKTDDGSAITSDFESAVNFAIPGEYTVTLQSTDNFGNVAEPVRVTVKIVSSTVPVISADSDVTYQQYATVSAAQFLRDDKASASNDGVVSSDFASAVNLEIAGDYIVTLNAVNSDGNVAVPVKVTVHVLAPKPDDPTNPINPVNPTKPVPNKSQVDSNKSEDVQRLPKTGDSSLPLAAFGWIIFVSGVLLLKKRK